MRLFARSLWVFTVFSIGGCAEVTGAPPGTAPVRITVEEFTGIEVPLEGVRLCEADTNNCATTDVQGEATLWLRVATETSFMATKERYGSHLRPLIVPEDGFSTTLTMASVAYLTTQYETVMSPYPPVDTGSIDAAAPLLSGVAFDLFDVNATGELTEKGYYVDENNNWSLDLAATTSVGHGGFVEVSPGEYQLQFGGTAENCTVRVGWPGVILPNSVRFPVREGYRTIVVMRCSFTP